MPSAIRCSRSRCVAAMMRVSTLDRLRAAQPLDLPLLEHAQQLDLDVERQIANLVEEDRRVIGELEAADLPRQRAGVGALLAAEQLALDQRRRESPRSSRGPSAACRRGLSSWICVANSSLPVPVSPSSSTVESVAATCCTCSIDLAHRGALADDDAGAETLAGFGAEIEIFGAQLLAPPFGVLERLVLRLFGLQPSQHAAQRLREDVQAMQRVGGPGAIFADHREDHRAGDAVRDHQRHDRGGSDAHLAEALAINRMRDLVETGERRRDAPPQRGVGPGELLTPGRERDIRRDTRPTPLRAHAHGPIGVEDAVRAAIERQRFAHLCAARRGTRRRRDPPADRSK